MIISLYRIYSNNGKSCFLCLITRNFEQDLHLINVKTDRQMHFGLWT